MTATRCTLLSLTLPLALALPTAQAQIAELSKLKGADLAAGDQFGVSVSFSGDRALVGALADDDLSTDAGAAYVFERQPDGAWSQVAKLHASDGAANDLFGIWVSLSGDRALIGALFDDDLGSDSGSAYVFERQDDGTWAQVAKLMASDGGPGNWFGTSVSISGDLALVGAQLDAPGSAHVFERDAGGAWTEVAKLTASDGWSGNLFGHEVSLSGGRALVGAYTDGSPPGTNTGAAYVFERGEDGAWVQVAKLTASDGAAGSQFGFSVSLAGDRALIGAGGNSPAGLLSGSAYLFDRQPSGAWAEVAKLTVSDATAGDGFGFAVGVLGDRAVVSSWSKDVPVPDAGVAYLFEPQATGNWNQTAKLTASDPAAGDAFAYSIALSGDRVLLGAWGYPSFENSPGSAYLFDFLPLSSDVAQVSLSSGEIQALAIDAGHLHAGESYALLGSASGTVPGLPLGANLVLPLNPDAYLTWTVDHPDDPPLSNALGTLSSSGSATAAFGLPAGDYPRLVGLTLHHAFVTMTTGLVVTSVSNAFPLTLAP